MRNTPMATITPPTGTTAGQPPLSTASCAAAPPCGRTCEPRMPRCAGRVRCAAGEVLAGISSMATPPITLDSGDELGEPVCVPGPFRARDADDAGIIGLDGDHALTRPCRALCAEVCRYRTEGGSVPARRHRCRPTMNLRRERFLIWLLCAFVMTDLPG